MLTHQGSYSDIGHPEAGIAGLSCPDPRVGSLTPSCWSPLLSCLLPVLPLQAWRRKKRNCLVRVELKVKKW